MTSSVRVEWRPDRALDIKSTIGSMRRGSGDPTFVIEATGAIWRTLRTPEGTATQHLRIMDGSVIADHWGLGAQWAAQRVPHLLGEFDDHGSFPSALLKESAHPRLHDTWTTLLHRGWRVPSSGEVFITLVAAVLEQKITGVEARRAWRWLVNKHGEDAPVAPGMPAGLKVAPEANGWKRIPSWDWHQAGVDSKRSGTIVSLCPYANRIDECRELPLDAARARLQSFPGIGIWTTAEVMQRALGDADAASFGDYHIPKNTVYALTGREDGDDDAMAQVLQPFAGHRFRVTRIVEVAGIQRPPRGPRMTIQDHRRI